MQACAYPIHILLLIFSSLTKMKCQKKYKKLIKSSVTGNCLLFALQKMSVTLQGLTTYANDFSSLILQLPRNPRTQLINVLEVDDPKISIVFHMIAPLESVTPHLESPLAEPMVLLRQLAKEELDKAKELQFSEGFLLKNLEANCKFEK